MLNTEKSDIESELLNSFQQEEINTSVTSGTVFMEAGGPRLYRHVEKGQGSHFRQGQARQEGRVGSGAGGQTVGKGTWG